MQKIDMRGAVPEFEKRCKIKSAFGVQSLELYCCDTLQPRRLLIGLRCGELIEAHLTDQEGQGQLDFNYTNFVEAHSSLNPSKNKKKIQCAVNPNHPVLVTAGDDMTLRIWNLESNKLIYKSFLGFEISALSYTPDGTYLTWG
jgi:WD40 repeat protein